MGFVWNQNLPISPVTQISSDRFCAVQIPSSDVNSTLYIFCVYLPSSDHVEEFSEYLSDLESAVSTLQPSGQVVLTGDFNCHLQDPSTNDEKVRLIQEFIQQHNL